MDLPGVSTKSKYLIVMINSFKMYLQVCEAQAHVAFLLGRILVYEHVIHIHYPAAI